jgi:hypothetical protein
VWFPAGGRLVRVLALHPLAALLLLVCLIAKELRENFSDQEAGEESGVFRSAQAA